jgi:hypothetical protein
VGCRTAGFAPCHTYLQEPGANDCADQRHYRRTDRAIGYDRGGGATRKHRIGAYWAVAYGRTRLGCLGSSACRPIGQRSTRNTSPDERQGHNRTIVNRRTRNDAAGNGAGFVWSIANDNPRHIITGQLESTKRSIPGGRAGNTNFNNVSAAERTVTQHSNRQRFCRRGRNCGNHRPIA